MGNPRRDVFEYGVLMTLATSMAAAYGFIIAYASQTNPDGTRRKLPKVNLEDEVDLGKAWEDTKRDITEMSWNKSTFSRWGPSAGNSVQGSGLTTPMSGNAGMQDKK